MGHDNQFYQYGYDHYLKAPKRPPAGTPIRSRGNGLGSRTLRKIQSPAVATVALLAAGSLFVGVIFATYPSGKETQQEIPIVKADLRPLKTFPQQRGGMDIPNRDSTLLARVGQPPVIDNNDRIENLLARSKEELMSKERALEQAMAVHPLNVPNLLEEDVDTPKVVVLSEVDPVFSEGTSSETAPTKSVKNLLDQVKPLEIPALKEPSPKNILQKIGSSESDDTVISSEFEQKVASAALLKKPAGKVQTKKPEAIYAAGTSPETIDFVRSVLNNPADNDVSAKRAAEIKPAAGAASTAAKVSSGSYFVQLASITDPARSGSEWAKMKAKYSVLSQEKFRVQEASVNSGTFYRIQAGPMSRQMRIIFVIP